MDKTTEWKTEAPNLIYNGYPNSDLLDIDPPVLNETIGVFKKRAEDAGDTLFLFLCREADEDCEDASEYIRRLEVAISQIQKLQDYINKNIV